MGFYGFLGWGEKFPLYGIQNIKCVCGGGGGGRIIGNNRNI